MIRLQAEPIALEELSKSVREDRDGAIALFVGTVRNANDGRRVRFLEYEAYPEMAEREMEAIAGETRARFPVARIAIVHRTGRLEIGETSIVIAVAAPHRAAALEACRFVIDSVKVRVPIWKREHFEGGAVWIEGPEGVPTPSLEP